MTRDLLWVDGAKKGALLALFVFACVFCQEVRAQGVAPAPSGRGVVLATAATSQQFLEDANRVIEAASQANVRWNGPRSGPRAVAAKRLAVIDEDLHNGGILAVNEGVLEAAKVIGWSVKVYDTGGTIHGQQAKLEEALNDKPDGLIIMGCDARTMVPWLSPFVARGIPIVGWHVTTTPGPVTGTPVAMNVSTDPLEVARVAALAAIVQSGGRAGVVIFTDTKYELAKAKAKVMADVIRSCAGCTLLDVRDIALSRNPELMPGATRELLGKYGSRWTHSLGINDIYFDYETPVLTQARLPNAAMSMLSAGDGSESAFLRIWAGTFQTATVAEPLILHGWQLIDELNRLLSRSPVTGFVFPVHLVTAENVSKDGGERLLYDPANGYRDIYRRIWQRP